MKTLLAIFGFIMLLILAVLTGGLGVIFLALGSETVREVLSKAVGKIIAQALFEDKEK